MEVYFPWLANDKRLSTIAVPGNVPIFAYLFPYGIGRYPQRGGGKYFLIYRPLPTGKRSGGLSGPGHADRVRPAGRGWLAG